MPIVIRAWLLFGLTISSLAGGGQASAQTFSDSLGQKPADIRPQDVIEWTPFEAVEHPDGRVEVTLRMSVKGDWKVYTHNLKFTGPGGYEVLKIAGPKTLRIVDPISTEEVDVYAGGEFQVSLTGAPAWTAERFPLQVTYVGCTNVICLFPYTHPMEAPFRKEANGEASAEPTGTAPGTMQEAAGAQPTIREEPVSQQPDFESQLAQKLRRGGGSLGFLLALVFVGGILSNLTPCVYPMIPITLRLLSKQGTSPYTSAAFYAAGIVVTYSSLGLVAALSGGLFGSLLASKPFNLAFAGLMFALGSSMLGFGNFSKLQMLGSRLGSGKPSHRNTFFMGAGAGLVAAPCTGPILAALLAYIAGKGGSVSSGVNLLFAYSLGFALPYVALGGAAAHLSKVKVSPQWQIATKLIFASIMFGLGLYYLRVPLYALFVMLRPFWKPLTLFAAGGGAFLTLVWVATPRLSGHKLSSLLPTLLFGLGIFAGSQWATSSPQGHESVTLYWYHDEASALAAAVKEKKPILADMWAEWCEACKKLDATTFKSPEVRATLANDFILLKFDLTELDAKSEEIQKKYEVQSLPTLILLPINGDVTHKKSVMGYVDGPGLLKEIKEFKASTF